MAPPSKPATMIPATARSSMLGVRSQACHDVGGTCESPRVIGIPATSANGFCKLNSIHGFSESTHQTVLCSRASWLQD
jgi:hypothetical protein